MNPTTTAPEIRCGLTDTSCLEKSPSQDRGEKDYFHNYIYRDYGDSADSNSLMGIAPYLFGHEEPKQYLMIYRLIWQTCGSIMHLDIHRRNVRAHGLQDDRSANILAAGLSTSRESTSDDEGAGAEIESAADTSVSTSDEALSEYMNDVDLPAALPPRTRRSIVVEVRSRRKGRISGPEGDEF